MLFIIILAVLAIAALTYWWWRTFFMPPPWQWPCWPEYIAWQKAKKACEEAMTKAKVRVRRVSTPTDSASLSCQ